MANKPELPKDEQDWERYKKIITDLYIVQNEKLTRVIDIMSEDHGFIASEKQYKTHFRNWNLAKNFKRHEAQLIVSGKLTGSARVRNANAEELKRRAQRSLKRSEARQKGSSVSQSTLQSPQSDRYPEQILSPQSAALIVAPHRPKPDQGGTPSLVTPSIKSFELLFHKLRFYTHEACVVGRHWDLESSTSGIGRKALRELSLDLTAGAKYYEEGKVNGAEILWGRALKRASRQDLLDTWYYETPIALLFELGRLVHKGHQKVAAQLIQVITRYAEEWLDEDDPRRSLFAAFEALEIPLLNDGYSSAALSLYEGLATRLEKHNPLLYQFGLHRALDLVWFDPKTNLKKWVPPVEDIDRAIGPNKPLSVYYLLLDAYRQVAAKNYTKADEISQEVSKRLNILEQTNPKAIDGLKICMAYRRLGRQYYEQEQYIDARRTLNQALRYLGTKKHSVLLEIYHLQEKMAQIAGDTYDVELWQEELRKMEDILAKQQQDEVPAPAQMGSITEMSPPAQVTSMNGSPVSTQFGSTQNILTPNTQLGSPDEIPIEMYASMDNYSSFNEFDFTNSMMYYQNSQVYSPVSYHQHQFPVPMNTTQTGPPVILHHENSAMRFTEDPEPLQNATFGNQPDFGAMNGSVNPNLTYNNGNFVQRPMMVSGQVFEIQDDQNTLSPSWPPGRL